ncbi:group-specific protein [Mechercharimyces sp. CAU 1602]|uniref:group-specific protein n=1 Tax=Mechercharimyces sp. CAU 1602 TaxID=2973933 RepID=UPI002162F088|nr:group-specific protein [Mechercharimyces sp. CAU 1602]MCS1350067.1 group-specific protein [Mechercharimyces sp. CAU 1602]
MTRLIQHGFQEGDWVKGTSIYDEMFQGYIESMEEKHESAKVRVIQSDHERVIGKVITSPLERLNPHDDVLPYEEGQLRNLIDISLSCNDKDWFIHLTSLLQKEQQANEQGVSSMDDTFKGCESFRKG